MATEWQTLLILTSRFPNKFEGILMIDRAFSFAVHRPFEMCLDPAASRRVWTAGGNRYNLGMSNSRGDTLGIPSGYVKIAIENDHRNSGFSHKQWWFSIVMWQFTRGYYGCLSGYLLVMFVPIRKKDAPLGGFFCGSPRLSPFFCSQCVAERWRRFMTSMANFLWKWEIDGNSPVNNHGLKMLEVFHRCRWIFGF